MQAVVRLVCLCCNFCFAAPLVVLFVCVRVPCLLTCVMASAASHALAGVIAEHPGLAPVSNAVEAEGEAEAEQEVVPPAVDWLRVNAVFRSFVIVKNSNYEGAEGPGHNVTIFQNAVDREAFEFVPVGWVWRTYWYRTYRFLVEFAALPIPEEVIVEVECQQVRPGYEIPAERQRFQGPLPAQLPLLQIPNGLTLRPVRR
jgi:hypothetical protein